MDGGREGWFRYGALREQQQFFRLLAVAPTREPDVDGHDPRRRQHRQRHVLYVLVSSIGGRLCGVRTIGSGTVPRLWC
jgi:hypothetical protein